MKIFIKIILCYFFLIILNNYSQAQKSESSVSSYGIFGNYNILQNSANFKELEGCVNCSQNKFGSVLGKGYSLGGLINFDFDDYELEARLGINFLESGIFESKENVVVGLSYYPVNVEFLNRINWNLTSINLGADFRYKISNKIGISFGLGFNYFFSSKFKYIEKVTDITYTFISTGTSERVIGDGIIPNLNKIQFFGKTSINYQIPLDKKKRVILKPELSYQYIFNDMINWADNESFWKMHKISIGFSLVYDNKPTTSIELKKEDIKPIDDTIYSEKIETYNDSKIKLEEENKRKFEELDRIKKELDEKEKFIAVFKQKESQEMQRIENEKLSLLKTLEQLNSNNSTKCKCYSVLFYVSDNQSVSENILNQLKNQNITDIIIDINTENSLKMKFYRVKSKCFQNPIDAIDLMYKINQNGNFKDIEPQIICDK